jgi:hypothetical protein
MAALAALGCGLVASGMAWGASGDRGVTGPDVSYPVELNLQSDICHHDQYIWGAGHPPPHNIKLTLTIGSGHFSLGGPPPWVAVGGPISDSGGLGGFGSGTVAGYPGTAVTFNGSLDTSRHTITGKYAFGAEGALPGGLPPCDDDNNPATFPDAHRAVYGVKPKQETVPEFLQLFATALQTGDTPFLLGRLNPHVIEAYGEANCAAAVAEMTDPTASFTINSTSGPASWTWSESGTPILIDNVYTVSVKRVAEGKSSVQDIHLAVVQGQLTWFRSCPPADTPTATETPEHCKIAGGSCPPTDTPTPPAVPPTATQTPANTATPAPGNGDCNHDGVANAIDALLSLQSGAGLLPNPGGCADVNRDGVVNALDAALVLQYSAGLIAHLPWP